MKVQLNERTLERGLFVGRLYFRVSRSPYSRIYTFAVDLRTR
jgi:hypothetical protein